jgi:hypothetical protein
MDKLFKTMPAILRAAGASDEVSEAACIAAWREAVGDGLSSHAVPLRLRNKTLVVAVADNLWQRQLEQMRGQLLFRLNSVLGAAQVRSIEWRIEPGTVTRARKAAAPDRKVVNDYRVPVELLQAAANINDVELRRAFLAAAMSCVQRLENSEL